MDSTYTITDTRPKTHLDAAIVLRVIGIVAISLPILLTVLHIARNGVNAPFWDEWGPSLDIVQAARSGTLTLQDLFAQHVAHRIVFTNLTSALSGILFRWNLHAEMFVSVMLMLANFALLSRLHRSRSIVLLLAMSIVLFSPRQQWLWAFVNQIYFALFWSLVVLVALATRRDMRGWLVAAIAAICATYSFGFGWLVWGAGVAVMVAYRAPRRHQIAWLILTGFNLALFFASFGDTGDMNLLFVFKVPAFIGSIFVQDAPVLVAVASVIGSVAMLQFVANALWLTNRGVDWRIWGILAVYIIAIFAMISIGYRHPLMPRYTAIGALFWCSAFVIMYEVLRRHPPRLLGVLNAVVIGILVASYIMLGSRYMASSLPVALPCLYEAASASDDCIEVFYPGADVVRPLIARAEQHQLTLFAP